MRLKGAFLTLPPHNEIDVIRFERLGRKQRRVPPPQNDRELRVPFLGGFGGINGVLDHGTGHHRDPQAKSVFHLLENALVVVRGDGGVDDSNFIPSLEQRG